MRALSKTAKVLLGLAVVVVVLLGVLLAFFFNSQSEAEQTGNWELVNTYDHDATNFTQGLEFLHDGRLVESTGLQDESKIVIYDVTDDGVREMHSIMVDHHNAPGGVPIFGEGITQVDDSTLISLTWQDEEAYIWNYRPGAEQVITLASDHTYPNEGWGICYDESTDKLWTSDGSATLVQRDPATLAEIANVAVTLDEQPLDRLNELECVNGAVYANVFTENYIVKIDPDTGVVTVSWNLTELAEQDGAINQERAGTGHVMNSVLNGIAYNTATDTFWVTGKNWHQYYEVKLG
ncbi:MAG: glutaminyl-peptide cyclotransferase [Actinomycetaceae bacterium]|nr:glutaminyl-peptide cyclotransferase [Actinomycetaceae bacterium]